MVRLRVISIPGMRRSATPGPPLVGTAHRTVHGMVCGTALRVGLVQVLVVGRRGWWWRGWLMRSAGWRRLRCRGRRRCGWPRWRSCWVRGIGCRRRAVRGWGGCVGLGR